MIKKWLTARRKRENTDIDIVQRLPVKEFQTAMDYAKQIISLETNEEDQLLMLDYILHTVKLDIMYDLISEILYKNWGVGEHYRRPFPTTYYDEQDNKIDFFKSEEVIEINLAEKHFLTTPWHRARFRVKLKEISKHGFRYCKTNHKVFYFTHIDLCYVESGHHSISTGIYKKQGTVKGIKCDLSKLFKNVHTDGRYWYNTHTEEILDDVWDFRIAVLYSIAKMKEDILFPTIKKSEQDGTIKKELKQRKVWE